MNQDNLNIDQMETVQEVSKPINGEYLVNGVSNGHSMDDLMKPPQTTEVLVSSKSSSSHHHRSSSSSSSSSSRSHHKSSSKDKHRDRDRDKDKDKDRGEHKSSRSSSSSSSKHHSSSGERKDKSSSGSSSSSSKDKDRHHSSSHKSSSSSSHRDKDKERDKGKDRDKDKEHEKDKERDKDKELDKDKPRDKDKDRKERSSSDKHKDDKSKHRSSSSSSASHHSKDKDRDKDKDRHKEKEKERDRSKDHKSSSGGGGENSNNSNHDKSLTSSTNTNNSHSESSTTVSTTTSSTPSSSSSASKDNKESRDKYKDKDRHRSSSSKDHRSKDHKHSSSNSSSSSKPKENSSSGAGGGGGSSSSSKNKHSSSSSRHDKERSKDKNRSSSSSLNHHKKPEKMETNDAPPNDGDDCFIVPTTDPLADPLYIKEENDIKMVNNDTYNHSTTSHNNQQILKNEMRNTSNASSCDYSLSQFNDDEKPFVIKQERSSKKMNSDDDDDDDYFNGSNARQRNSINNNTKLNSDDDEDVGDGTGNVDGRGSNGRDYGGGGDNHVNFNNHVKKEEDDDDEEDLPIATRKRVIKPEDDDDDEDDLPLTARKQIKTEKVKQEKVKKAKKKKRDESDEEESDDEYDDKPKKKKVKKEKKDRKFKQEPTPIKKQEAISPQKPGGGRKKKDDQQENVWKWWEEEKRQDGVKWSFLEHKGPVFAPPYEPIPENIKFEYDGKAMKLSQDAEEIACFYAKMLEHDYTSKNIFNDNFFKDWRRAMTSKEKEKITKLDKCNFKHMHKYFQGISEKNKNRSKDEKLAIKTENERLIAEYGFCTIDGHKEKIGNFRLEPPGLFRGRGEHPKMGLVKRRLMPEDILINCSKDSHMPEAPKGHRWREVRHDNTVTWLASWTENVQGQVKYIMLNPSSKLKGEKDWQKYETARRLHKHIDKIRNTYREEWKSKEMRIRQRAVALYFIDKLALRAGNEKDEDQADTVGCCSLRVEHIQLHKKFNDKENVVVFDFLGKDSIRYYNEVEVEKRVFKNLELFKDNKKDGDDLFDRLNTVVMNEHLRELMDGLTAKVFRTYNASWTLQTQLEAMTDPTATIHEKLLAYNRANRAVAILCNHQRSIPKSHEKSMENLKEKIRQKREQIDDFESELHDLVRAAKRGSVKEKVIADKKKKALEKLKEQVKKMELQETDRDENKTIALGTSKLNYLDPRISVAWCKKHGVPIEKIYNKTQRDKFRWAVDMATEDYHF